MRCLIAHALTQKEKLITPEKNTLSYQGRLDAQQTVGAKSLTPLRKITCPCVTPETLL